LRVSVVGGQSEGDYPERAEDALMLAIVHV